MLLGSALFLLFLCIRASPGKSPRRGFSDSFDSDVHASDFEVSTSIGSPTQIEVGHAGSSSSSSSFEETTASGDTSDDFISVERQQRREPSEASIHAREALMREMSRIAGSRFGISEMIQESSGQGPEEEFLHQSDFDTSSQDKEAYTTEGLDSGETTEEDDTFDDEVWTVDPVGCERRQSNGFRRRESVEAILRESLRNNRRARLLHRSQGCRNRKACQVCLQSDPPSINVDNTETKETEDNYDLNTRFFSSLTLDGPGSATESKTRRALKSEDGSTAIESNGPTGQEGENAPSSTAISPDTAHRLAHMLAGPNPRWRKVSTGYKPSVSVSRTPSPKAVHRFKGSDHEDVS